MLSFEPHPFSHFVLTCWCGLSYFVKCIEGRFSMFFDEPMSFLYHFVICNACWFFHCAWAVSQEEFVGAAFGGHVGPMIMHEGRDGELCIPVILPC